ncbi:MAG: type III pantothenate kinase [Gammaproteobacteria bacterium]|nr:type III pantothenate kinase [Pseudomonadales bacterium]MCP5346966.1 type III pantothenate kinase [Pseudomonadales bacterium]
MILELDIGNSRIKWRLLDSAGRTQSTGIAEQPKQLLDVTLAGQAIQRVRVSCVRPGELLSELTRDLAETRGIAVEIARVQRHCQGVTVAYQDLSRLGVDRWLTLLAAFRSSGGAAIIVDCGTAVTVDLLDDHGNHQGGYIVPGLKLGPAALTRDTAIRLSATPQWGLEPGNSTEEAIYHGALIMLTALLEKVVSRELGRLTTEQSPAVILTGGDAALIGRYLNLGQTTIQQMPELVFDGLGIALP